MKNEIKKITKEEWQLRKQQLKQKKGIWIAEIDGKKAPTWKDYAREVEHVFQFPTPCDKSMDAYLDWITDLSWLQARKYVLIIYNFKDFMKEELENKENIIWLFEEDVLPFWESGVEQYVVGGKAKPFNIYLVD